MFIEVLSTIGPIGHLAKLLGYMTNITFLALPELTCFKPLNEVWPKGSTPQMSQDSSILNAIVKHFEKKYEEQERKEIIPQYSPLRTILAQPLTKDQY